MTRHLSPASLAAVVVDLLTGVYITGREALRRWSAS